MLNAAKADGHIDEAEIKRIFGKLQEKGVDEETRAYVISEIRRPMDLDGIVTAAKGRPDLGARLYAASLLAIKVDTPGEKNICRPLPVASVLIRRWFPCWKKPWVWPNCDNDPMHIPIRPSNLSTGGGNYGFI